MIGIQKTGWVGVDVGTSTVKLAQLTRSKKGLRVTGLAIVPRRVAWSIADLADHAPLSSADEMCAAVSLRPSFRGKQAAATLPMALCGVHTLDRPSGGEIESHQVRGAIEMATQRSAEGLQFDVWDAEPEEENGIAKKLNILTVATHWSDQLFDDLTESGWSCQTIDGLPLSLARAVALVEPPDSAVPTAALDWGFAKATLCVVVEGRPVYVRNLKNCGLHRLIDKLIEELGVTREESQRLLQEYGLGRSASSTSLPAGKLVEEIIAEPLARLAGEIQRTFSHLQFQRRAIVPESLYLFGGGATICGLARHLSHALETKVETWQLGGEQSALFETPEMPSCLFGPAIALSALAWEKP